MIRPETDQIDAIIRDLPPAASAAVIDSLITNVRDHLYGIDHPHAAELAVALSVAGLAHARLMTALNVDRDPDKAATALQQIQAEVHRLH